MLNITNITPPRVDFLDQRTGKVSREWYLFFLNLFNLTGGGTTDTTLIDLQKTPSHPDNSTLASSVDELLKSPVTADNAAMLSSIDSILKSPPHPENLWSDSISVDTTSSKLAEMSSQIEGLLMTPPPQSSDSLSNDIHDAVSKVPPADADEIPITDSASGYTLAKLTWANLKATLAVWIDGNLIPATFTSITSSTTGKVATTLGVGNATPSASGSGVTFPASQSASTDVNTLDDYEEGSFTPTILFGGASTGNVYTLQLARYTKIGDVVQISGACILSTKGSSTGVATMGGLPFSVGGTNAYIGPMGIRLDSITYTGAPQNYFVPGTTTVQFEKYTEAGVATNLNDTNFSNTSSIIFSGQYAV